MTHVNNVTNAYWQSLWRGKGYINASRVAHSYFFIELMNEKKKKKMEGKKDQSKSSQWGVVGGGSKVSHLVVTITGFTLSFDIFSTSRDSTHFCTLFPCKKQPLDQLLLIIY